MGAKLMILAVVVMLVAFYIHLKITTFSPPPAIKDVWFGRGSQTSAKEDVSIRPFRLRVSDEVLLDLKQRLTDSRFSGDLENTGSQYGMQNAYMKKVQSYWRDDYDWRKHEKIINSFPQFKTTIEGIEIHFLHIKPARGRGKPLLMTHGWPGSVWEFHKIIPRLTDPASYGGLENDTFEVICPSIPGYGFSEAPHQTGFNAMATARIFVELMRRLGHDKFYAHGGDWGSMVSTTLAQVFPKHVLGVHLTLYLPPIYHPASTYRRIMGSLFPSLCGVTEFEYEEGFHLKKAIFKAFKELGYMHLQATRPDTIAHGLNNSPLGLAAYLLEKFSVWTDPDYLERPDAGLEEKFTLDELLTNVMIYWVSGTIGSSMRYYRENFAGDTLEQLDGVAVTVPSGMASFPKELFYTPKYLAEIRFQNIVHYTYMKTGGHFPALEEPKLLADDVIAFVRTVEGR